MIVCLVGTITFFLFYKNNAVAKHKKLHIVCTTNIIGDALKQIAGDLVELRILMGPGVDPHVYRARESDMRALRDADIIFYNGLHLEGKMSDLFANMKQLKNTIAIGDALEKEQLIYTPFDNIADPHIWHEVSLWIKVVAYIKDALVEADQKNAHLYAERAATYSKQLTDLHAYVQQCAQKIPKANRIVITAHDAFHYFARAYDFTVVGLQGISTDAQISVRDLQNLALYVVEHKVPVIFVETALPLKNMQALQQAVTAHNWSVQIGPHLYADALGDEQSDGGTYVGMIKHNIDAIVSALCV